MVAGAGLDGDGDPLAGGPDDWPVGEAAEADLGPLQVGECRDVAACGIRGTADFVESPAVLAVLAVTEVQPGHVHAGLDEGPQPFWRVRGWAEGAHDLRLPRHGLQPRSHGSVRAHPRGSVNASSASKALKNSGTAEAEQRPYLALLTQHGAVLDVEQLAVVQAIDRAILRLMSGRVPVGHHHQRAVHMLEQRRSPLRRIRLVVNLRGRTLGRRGDPSRHRHVVRMERAAVRAEGEDRVWAHILDDLLQPSHRPRWVECRAVAIRVIEPDVFG